MNWKRFLCWLGIHPGFDITGVEHDDELLVVFETICPVCSEVRFRYINRPGRNL